MKYEIINLHISRIAIGDTVMHNGKMFTVGKDDIKSGGFCGITLFGDSYNMGTKPVKKILFLR